MLQQSVGGSSWSDAPPLSPLSLVLCPPTPRKAPATSAPLTLAHLITRALIDGFYGPQVLGGPALMTASRGSPYFQPPTNWITYFQSPFNPSNWGRNSHLIDDFTNKIAGGKSLRQSKCRMLSTLSALFLQLHQSLYKADGCCTEMWTLMIRKR